MMGLADRAKGAYRRAFEKVGEPVTLRTFNGNPRLATDKTIQARVIDYTPQELLAGKGLVQGDQKLIVLAEDVSAPKKNDMALFRGAAATIQAVDDNTRRIAGVLIAYEIQVRG